MPEFSNSNDNSVSLAELRLKTAMKINTLKQDIEKCQELEKAALEAGDMARVKALAELQQRAQLEIARLKINAEKYQKLEKQRTEPKSVDEPKEIFPVQTPAPFINQDKSKECPPKKTTKESAQPKTPKPKGIVKQAMSLLGNLGK